MDLLKYIESPLFTDNERFAIRRWQSHFLLDPRLQFVLMSINLECKRHDIHVDVWTFFLRDIATAYGPDRSDPKPFSIACALIRVNAKRYFLPGQELCSPPPMLYHYIEIGNFVKHLCNERNINIPIPFALRDDVLREIASTAINDGELTGSHLEGKVFGRRGDTRDYPVWVSDGSLAQEPSSAKAAAMLGMGHFAGGVLVEVSYSVSLLQTHHEVLHAPTVLDALAWTESTNEKPDEWVFLKTQERGGPSMGFTVNLDGRPYSRGVPEAVHAPFEIRVGNAPQLRLRSLDLAACEKVTLDHFEMLQDLCPEFLWYR